EDLIRLSKGEMDRFVRDQGWSAFRADQIRSWIYRKKATAFGEMTNLSKADRSVLENRAKLGGLHLIQRQESRDGTRKYLFGLEDGKAVESVLIPDNGRNTLCISTQVGCTLDCTFCLTGTMGLSRNLKAHEIVLQVLWIQREIETEGESGDRLTNIVFMGMGEPLANYREVVEALARLIDQGLVGFPPRRITVSTAGLVPQMKRLGGEDLNVNLAVSLNATTDAVRDRIMPAINKQYPIKTLLEACRDYPLSPRRRLYIEYILLKGVNDSPEDARRLKRLLSSIRCKVNLIPFNAYPGSPFGRPSDNAVLDFQKILLDAGMTVFLRKSRGRDILAACGQLKTQGTP
ncbi:MAG TPA: 23S rRNA (adenine(2503)-C(2))-methyltransferase RlmN, partial [Nitrospiria bacterium]